jgi:hypothetical protein
MQLRYKVKLDKGHTAKDDQIVNGFLGNVFGTGRVELYSRGEAVQKANMFGGHIELHKVSFYIADIKVAQIDRKTISEDVERLMNEQGKVYGREKDDDGFYYANVIDDILNHPTLVITDDKLLQELQDLSQYLTNYDYIMLIS